MLERHDMEMAKHIGRKNETHEQKKRDSRVEQEGEWV